MEENKVKVTLVPTDLDKFRRHMAKPIKFTVENDGLKDEFELKPLSIELFSEFMLISERLETEPENEMMGELIDLYIKILQNTYPGLEKEIAYNFMVLNMNEFTEALQKLMPTKLNEKQQELLKKKMKELQDAKSSSKSPE